MEKVIKIRNKKIGDNQPLFVIAECGVTCNYDMGMSKELIDVVCESGADAIKFILWFPDEIMSDKTISYKYQTVHGERTENMFEMLNKLRFNLKQWHELKAYADKKGVVMLCTVNSPTGIKWAEEIRLEAYKLSSWDFNYHPLWEDIAKLGKPMLIDTGPVDTLEVAQVMNLMKKHGNDKSVLVHCYHTDIPEQINMLSIPYMRKAFDSLVGFSAKDLNNEMDILSVALGSCYLEKRLTMKQSLPGHHHNISLEPKEFKSYVQMIRDVQKSLGIEDLAPSQADLSEKKKWFRHVVVDKDVKKGTKITQKLLACKRPAGGISPEHINFVIGKTLKRDLKRNEAVEWEDI